MTGGELPALSVMDAVARFVPGVLGKLVSAEEDSFPVPFGASSVHAAHFL